MLYRKAYEYIESWFQSNSKKALLVDGARQIGKTYIIRNFLKNNAESYVEFNLYENNLAKEALETANNSKDLTIKISALTKKPLVKGKTIIFIDEIQAANDVVTKVKFLIEEGSYRYIFSGSLLVGVNYNNITSLPVGYMDILEMYPLDFEEFCLANGVKKETITYLQTQFKNLDPIDNIVHKQMLNLFNLYTIVGGFPEVVNKFIETSNLQDVYSLHDSIDKLYKLDISKYNKENTLLIKDIYSLIPSELNNPNKRFILKNLNEKGRFYQYEDSFVWLLNSNIGLFTYNVDNPVYPLLASKERTLFKLFLCDTGLLCHYLYSDNVYKILNNNVDVNYGSIYENAVAQELKCHDFNLFYYNNKKNGEVDFIIEKGTKIIPIEVKSGKDYKRHVALENLLNNYSSTIKEGYTLCQSNIERNNNRIYLPIYLIMFFDNKHEAKKQIINIDISAL